MAELGAHLKIGVIGAGAMGSGILKSLIRAGHNCLAFDIDEARMQDARSYGAGVCVSAEQLLTQAQVVFIVVVDAGQIDQVLKQALPSCNPGTFVVLCSTISPSSTIDFCQRIDAAGGFAVDAPISGGPARAESAQMSMMLAAQSAHLSALMPLFKQMSAVQFVISENVGDAAKAKLVNNLLAAINLAGAAEAMAFANILGLHDKQIFNLMSASSGQSWIMQDRISRALDGDYAPRAAAHVLTKDVTLANQLAAEHKLKLPLGDQARQALQATCDGGWRLEDDAAILKYYCAKYSHMPE